MLRKQNNEKMQLEKELDREEREAMERFIQTEDGKKQDKVGQLTNGLAGQLQGINTLLNKFCYIELGFFFFFFFFFLQKCVFKIISNYRILILFNSSIPPLVVMYTTFNEVSGEGRNPIYAIECVYISIKRPKMSVMAKIWT